MITFEPRWSPFNLRIGTATAKGLCYALDIPLIAVNTLEAMAYQFKDLPMEADYLCPMIDARRMEVYCAVITRSLKTVSETRAVVVKNGVFDKWLQQGKVLFFGNGSGKCKEVLHGQNSLFVEDVLPNAASVGFLGTVKFETGAFE